MIYALDKIRKNPGRVARGLISSGLRQ